MRAAALRAESEYGKELMSRLGVKDATMSVPEFKISDRGPGLGAPII